ncbi:polyribonucleotide nucleotidyltransferase [Candidatus Falkowbacteria bacterium CG10_big_fil_rev_8_21_14_0_10_43_11]|uniref:Polyribonucleotide nucleotidyltransferase n=1 Tax=Candidatus Falkowbacteria bacterium CG10_big_fil_rev_8_21_14_0_10_43_11 TaxID=1974568 RepID=A0A2M6WMT4_9BACT|nr:MAG: polyribonucleotide nucleotidyltransferase [Candidatus Falkowbacteria bacterium CG10_big_fil_rev_8_21_14_0_10_43_11]
MEEKKYVCEWLGRTLSISTGKLAQQATASVTVRYGDTVVLAAVVQAKEPKEGMDYFPLLVGYEERLYAAGIIKGSRWIKREGRPSDESVLAGRMIDRAIRPLFDQKNRQDVQITFTILSADGENDPEIVSLIAASATLAISNINWRGPIAGVKVGRIDGKFVFNPSVEQEKASDLDLTVAGMEDRIIMLEAGAKEVGEKEMFEAMKEALKEMKPALDLIKKMAKELKPEIMETKAAAEPVAEEKQALELAKNWITKNAAEYLFSKEISTGKKQERKAQVTAIKEKAINYLFEQGVAYSFAKKAVETTHYEIIEAEVTRGIMERDERVDGRKLDEIRTLSSEVALLPRTHGSAVFQRGETQVLSTVTLGSPGDEQFLENLEGKSTKKYMHHYNFPPYSVGEVKPSFGPSRRDIGHGALAEKAIKPMLPVEEEFPYTIRVVSEVLGSNGSSSMGSTCGSSLALMDAGVPIKKAVAGVAMGLASAPDMKKWKIITDLQDLEDGEGGMDFKVAGTADGITAIQLDTKTIGLPMELVEETLARAKKARLEILAVMAKAISAPRPELSPYAPRIISFKIDPARIGEVIGTGGKIINGIIKDTGVTIDISDEGLVSICSTDAEGMAKAKQIIEDILREFKPGETFRGKVTRVMDFGVIVSLPGGNDGMVHVSEMAPYRVGQPADLLKIGDEVEVCVKGVEDDRISLTMKGLASNAELWKEEKGKQESGFGGGGGFSRGGSSHHEHRDGDRNNRHGFRR